MGFWGHAPREPIPALFGVGYPPEHLRGGAKFQLDRSSGFRLAEG